MVTFILLVFFRAGPIGKGLFTLLTDSLFVVHLLDEAVSVRRAYRKTLLTRQVVLG